MVFPPLLQQQKTHSTLSLSISVALLHTCNTPCRTVCKVQRWFNEHIHQWKTGKHERKSTVHAALSQILIISLESVFLHVYQNRFDLQ